MGRPRLDLGRRFVLSVVVLGFSAPTGCSFSGKQCGSDFTCHLDVVIDKSSKLTWEREPSLM
jgi:hypothetical protein